MGRGQDLIQLFEHARFAFRKVNQCSFLVQMLKQPPQNSGIGTSFNNHHSCNHHSSIKKPQPSINPTSNLSFNNARFLWSRATSLVNHALPKTLYYSNGGGQNQIHSGRGTFNVITRQRGKQDEWASLKACRQPTKWRKPYFNWSF